jgi:hypothetical protein
MERLQCRQDRKDSKACKKYKTQRQARTERPRGKEE